MELPAGVRRPAEFGPEIYCPKCAYCLFGTEGNACPACGYSLENLRLAESRIPWVRRKEIGPLAAYVKTVGLVLFRHRRFCEEYARDVSYPDARKFQWATCLIVVVLEGLSRGPQQFVPSRQQPNSRRKV